MTLRLAAAALFLIALPQECLAGSVTVILRGEVPARPVRVRLLVDPIDAPPSVNRRDVSVDVRGRADVDVGVEGSPRWRVRAQAEGFWSEDLVIDSQAREAPQLVLWPAGSVGGRLVPRKGSEPELDSVLVQFTSSAAAARASAGAGASTEGGPSGVAECPVEKGYWRCVLPAGLEDLRIRTKGQSSHFRPGIRVKAGEVAELGDVEFPTGATVFGRVRHTRAASGRSEGESKEPTVQIMRSIPGAGTLVPAASPVHGREGSFAFEGLTKGHYVVLAAGEGYLPDRLELDIAGTDDVELPPLDLTRTCRLRVGVSPPLDPQGKPWKVLLYDARPAWRSAPPQEAAVDRSGAWTFGRAGVGRPYRLTLLTSWDEPWWRDEADFTPSAEQESRVIPLDIVDVSGTPRLGKQGLSGRVIFKDTARGVEVNLKLDREGRFAGPIPRAGAWEVQISADAPPVRRKLEVVVPKGGGEIGLAFPATAIEGEVTDEAGRRIQGCTLYLTRVTPPESLSYRLDDGVILLAGLAPGEYDAYAKSPGRESALYTVTVNEDGSSDPSPLRIVAKLRHTLRGRVVNAEGGPVAGASVQLIGSAGDLNPLVLTARATDESGRFTVELRDDQKTPCLWISPKAASARILQVSQTDEEQTIVSPQQGGVIRMSFSEPSTSPQATLKYLIRGNCFISAALLKYFGSGVSTVDGETVLQTPLFESGAYTLCGLKPGEIGAFAGGLPPFTNCSSGVLSNQGRLVLKVK